MSIIGIVTKRRKTVAGPLPPGDALAVGRDPESSAGVLVEVADNVARQAVADSQGTVPSAAPALQATPLHPSGASLTLLKLTIAALAR